jgi:hypothetical protein
MAIKSTHLLFEIGEFVVTRKKQKNRRMLNVEPKKLFNWRFRFLRDLLKKTAEQQNSECRTAEGHVGEMF